MKRFMFKRGRNWPILICPLILTWMVAVSADQANGVVRGLVLDSFGFPVPGAVVSLYSGDATIGSVSVDGAGWYRFEVDSGGSGTCTIEASGEGFIGEKKQLEVRPGFMTGVDFFLQRSSLSEDPVTVTLRYSRGELVGEVKGPSGVPIMRGWITLYEAGPEGVALGGWDDPSSWKRIDYRVLDTRGGFRFSGLSPGPYLVRAFIEGYPASEALKVEPDRSGQAEIVVTKRAETGQIEALRRLNWHRIQAGLSPVLLDQELNRQTQLHAEYHVSIDDDPLAEGLGAHFEYPGRPRFTAEGLVGGLSSNGVPGDLEPRESIDGWINTLYHRIGPLNPALRVTGFARLTSSWLSGRGTSRKSGIGVVRYPADGQIGVPTEFSGYEYPPPLPQGAPKPVGYVITLHFNGNPPPTVKDVEAGLSDLEGREVPVYLSWPERPANPGFPQDGVVCLIPREPLDDDRQYVVSITGAVEGAGFAEAWTFSTGEFIRPVDLDRIAPPGLRPSIVLEALPRLSGRVTDNTGGPVTDGWVALFREAEQVGFSWLDEEDGSYETGIVPAGDYTVKVYPGISYHTIEEGISLTSGHLRTDYTVDTREIDTRSLGVAFGKPVRVSYAQMPHLGDFVVDGESQDSHGMWIADPFGTIMEMMNPDSRENPDTPHWIEIDLEETIVIDRVHLFLPWWEETPQRYRISVSGDGREWTGVADNLDNPTVPTASGEAFQFTPVEARFVRLEMAPTRRHTAATVLELRVFRAGSHAVDGIVDDTCGLPDVQVLSDPRGDTSGPGSYDLRALHAVLHRNDLILATDHYEKGRDPGRLYHTIHIQAFDRGGGKLNYWIQSNRSGWVQISRYEDGVPFERWEKLLTPGNFSWCMGDGGEWKMPRTLFGDAEVLKVRAIDAGYDRSGAVQLEGDSTPWLIVDLSPVRIVPDHRTGGAPLRVRLTPENENRSIGITSYSWDLDGDGSEDSREESPTHVYHDPGLYTVRLVTTDELERQFTSTCVIAVGEEDQVPGIRVDGQVWDWEMVPREGVHSFDDPEGDSGEGPAGYDIKDLSFFSEDGLLFITVDYHSSVRSLADAIHTFFIRSYGGDSPGIWLHLGPGWMTLKEIRDGAPWEEWPDIQIDRSTFMEAGLIFENGEWGIPLSLLGNPPLVSLRYSVGIEQWDADSVESYKIKTSLAEPGVFYADGDLGDLLSTRRLASIDDPRGDTEEKNSFDIKTLYGAAGDASVMLGADFHQTAEPPEQIQQTLHIQVFGRDKMNYWIASGLTGWVTISRFRDGTPFEEWEQLSVPPGFDWGLFPQGIEWKIPLDLFTGADRISVMYISGGYDSSGNVVWQSDSTDWMELELRFSLTGSTQ